MYAHMVCNGNPGVVGLSTLNAGVRIASHIPARCMLAIYKRFRTNSLPVWSFKTSKKIFKNCTIGSRVTRM